MPSEAKTWVLNYINADRTEGEKITPENAKKIYFPKERLSAEREFGKEIVNELLGSPSHLEKAEMLFLEIEKGKLTKEEKYENLINIAYSITNACGKELDSDNPVYEKYAMIHEGIPIQMRENTSDEEKLSFLSMKRVERKVDVEFLKKMKMRIVLDRTAELLLDSDLEAWFDYIFTLVYVSLKEIFEEVKAEILGE